MKCPVHRRYLGKLKPRCLCYPCWVIYVTAHKGEKFTGREMLSLGEAAVAFEGNRLTARGGWK